MRLTARLHGLPDRVMAAEAGVPGMDARVLLAASVCLPLLAGCAAPPEGVPLLTAQEAVAQATLLRPQASLIAVTGVEGALPGADRESQAYRDDGIADGALGDGRLSSWVVALLDGPTYVEARAHGDGRTTFAELPMPASLHDEQVFIPVGQAIDSDEAAKAARRAHAYARDADRAAGYLYAYSLVERRHKAYDDGEASATELGGRVHSDSWAITHVTSDAVTSQLVATTAHLRKDGDLLGCAVQHLAETLPVFEGPLSFEESAGQATTHHFVFQVPDGAHRMTGGLALRPTSLLPNDEVRLRLLQPDGGVLAIMEGRSHLPVWLDDPTPGAWTLEITSSLPGAGDTIVLTGSLWATVPVLP